MEEIVKEEVDSIMNPPLEEGFSDKTIKVNQQQIHDLLFSEKLSWQAIIYDLINTEQLDPWDMDLILLTNKYLEKIRLLEEASFFISSKVLLAASLLLRIKSEILLNRDLPTLDEILFGVKEKGIHVQERIELEGNIPGLIPRTPLPRFRKVSLQELMAALNKAIATENRRIKRVVLSKQYEMEVAAVIPKRTVNLKDKIEEIYKKLEEMFENREEKLAFSEIWGETKDERIYSFVSLLHLDNQQRVWLEQENHFEEIWILLKRLYDIKHEKELMEMKKEVELEFERLALEEQKKAEEERAEEMESEKRSERAKKAWEKRKGKSLEETKDIEEDSDFNNEKAENFDEIEKSFSNSIDKLSENESSKEDEVNEGSE